MEQTDGAKISSGRDGMLAYHVLRYVPNLVRDEWVNIGVLVFNPRTGEKKLRMIEDEQEFNRIRRLHPRADDRILRALRDDLVNRLDPGTNGNGATPGPIRWESVLNKWEDTLSNALQIAPQKGLEANDIEQEIERLYADHVAVPARPARPGLPGSRRQILDYCRQVFRQAGIWDRLNKSVRVAEFTFPGDPARLDFSYRRNGTQGFIHALSVSRSPQDSKSLSYNVRHIAEKGRFKSEFAAVTDVRLNRENDRHRFVWDTLQEVGIEPVAMEGLASWTPKLASSLLQ